MKKYFIYPAACFLFVVLLILSSSPEASEVTIDWIASGNRAESSIPVLWFDIDETRGTIDAMNTSEDHSVNCYGSVDIQVPEGYQSEYMDSPAADMEDLELDYIRGRGEFDLESG